MYVPRAVPVERRNQELKKGLRILAVEDGDLEWDQAVEMSPAEALFGSGYEDPDSGTYSRSEGLTTLQLGLDA